MILSGTGSDGSRGIRSIHDAGGTVIVQDPDTAKFDGMPHSAVDTGVVDFVVPPDSIPRVILANAALQSSRCEPPLNADVSEEGMNAIFRILRGEYGIDFSYYKPSTVTRRIERRRQLNQSLDLEDYVKRLRNDAEEVNLLYKDLLIGVTEFFRDREAFDRLEAEVIPQLLSRIEQGDEIRVWVAGCATGEEAYSIAMLLDEATDQAGRNCDFKIFATDVHRASLDFASLGTYDESSLVKVSPSRLERYFLRHGNHYHVSQDLRKRIVFAPHNVIRDAPFTKLDLISCRNLLIYLQPSAQKKVLSLFHFGLRAGGIMLLGPGESPGEISDEFDQINGHWKIFRKRRDIRLAPDLRLPLSAGHMNVRPPQAPPGYPDLDLLRAYDSLLEEYVPPSVLLDSQRQVIHTFAGAGRYLAPRDGRMSTDILELVDRELKLVLAGALQRAAKQLAPVNYTGTRVETTTGIEEIKVRVKPITARSPASPFSWCPWRVCLRPCHWPSNRK